MANYLEEYTWIRLSTKQIQAFIKEASGCALLLEVIGAAGLSAGVLAVWESTASLSTLLLLRGLTVRRNEKEARIRLP